MPAANRQNILPSSMQVATNILQFLIFTKFIGFSYAILRPDRSRRHRKKEMRGSWLQLVMPPVVSYQDPLSYQSQADRGSPTAMVRSYISEGSSVFQTYYRRGHIIFVFEVGYYPLLVFRPFHFFQVFKDGFYNISRQPTTYSSSFSASSVNTNPPSVTHTLPNSKLPA